MTANKRLVDRCVATSTSTITVKTILCLNSGSLFIQSQILIRNSSVILLTKDDNGSAQLVSREMRRISFFSIILIFQSLCYSWIYVFPQLSLCFQYTSIDIMHWESHLAKLNKLLNSVYTQQQVLTPDFCLMLTLKYALVDPTAILKWPNWVLWEIVTLQVLTKYQS